jgi:hypothetical protein
VKLSGVDSIPSVQAAAGTESLGETPAPADSAVTAAAGDPPVRYRQDCSTGDFFPAAGSPQERQPEIVMSGV